MSTEKTLENKRNSLTIKNKIKILEKLKSGVPRNEICNVFNCSASTITRIIKNKETYTNIAQQNKNISKKRIRAGVSKEVECALLLWFREMRSKEAIITGPLLLEKAKFFAKKLNVNFEPKPGWLERWKQRENIHFKNVHGEKSSADGVSSKEWVRNILPGYLQLYSEDEIYNADESALLFKALPSGTLAKKFEKTSGKKLPKDRLTILFITNSTGSHKQIYCIGRSQNPRCFKNVSIPVKCYANSKAWMTSIIRTEIIKKLDSEFIAIGKKIILLVDNAACHKICDGTILENIKIVFLPPNTTSLIQPLDQGIIRSFKAHYRKIIVSKQLLELECGISMIEFSKKIDLLEALKMIKIAWSKVSTETIRNCFKKAGVINTNEECLEEDLDISILSEVLDSNINHLIDIDNNIDCLTDQEIIEEVTYVDNENADNAVNNILVKTSMKEALASINVLKNFFGDNLECLDKINDLEEAMCQAHLKHLKQTKINSYFNASI